MIMDMLDGRVARLMKATSRSASSTTRWRPHLVRGAPAFLLYSSRCAISARPAWFAAFLFVICGALRLARFNVITGSSDKRYFIGLPIPAGAAVACSVVILLHGEDLARWMRVSVAIVTYWCAAHGLDVPLLELQGFDWAKRPPVHTLLIVVLAGMIVATKHEVFLFLGVRRLRGLRAGRRLVVGHTPAPTLSEVLGKELREGEGKDRGRRPWTESSSSTPRSVTVSSHPGSR